MGVCRLPVCCPSVLGTPVVSHSNNRRVTFNWPLTLHPPCSDRRAPTSLSSSCLSSRVCIMGCGHSSNPNPPSEPAPALHPNTTVAAPDNTPTPTQADNQTPKAEHTTGEEKTREIATSDPPQSAAPPSAASSSTAATSSPPAPATVDLDRHLDEAADLEHKLRNNMSAPVGNSASGDAADASAAPPAWKSFTPDQLAAIDDARAAVRAKGPLVMDPKGTYGLICRACTKPNSTNVTFCTGCSFPSTVEDIQRLPDNIFLLLGQATQRQAPTGSTPHIGLADTSHDRCVWLTCLCLYVVLVCFSPGSGYRCHGVLSRRRHGVLQ